MGFKTDTIAAISTAMTNSESESCVSAEKMRFLLLTKFTKAKTEASVRTKKPYHSLWLYHGRRKQTIDEVLVLLMRGPCATPVKILWKSTVTAVYLSQERYLKP